MKDICVFLFNFTTWPFSAIRWLYYDDVILYKYVRFFYDWAWHWNFFWIATIHMNRPILMIEFCEKCLPHINNAEHGINLTSFTNGIQMISREKIHCSFESS